MNFSKVGPILDASKQVGIKIPAHVGLVGVLTVSYAHLEETIEYIWQPDAPNSLACVGCELVPNCPETNTVCMSCKNGGVWRER
jgi:hypothetical protein